MSDFTAQFSKELITKWPFSEIAKKLKGRYTNIAEEYLNKEVVGFVRAEIKIKPNLPDKLKTLPHVVGNIEIEFAAEK